MDDDSEHKKAKGMKKCVIKRELTFENYKDSLFNNQIILKSQQRFKSDHHLIDHLKVMMIRDCKHSIELQHIHME